MTPLIGSTSFCVSIQLIKEHQTLIVFNFKTKSNSKINSLNLLLCIKLTFCCSLNWLVIVIPSIRKRDSVSNDIMVFAKLCHIYKLIQVEIFLLRPGFFKNEKKRTCCVLVFSQQSYCLKLELSLEMKL